MSGIEKMRHTDKVVITCGQGSSTLVLGFGARNIKSYIEDIRLLHVSSVSGIASGSSGASAKRGMVVTVNELPSTGTITSVETSGTIHSEHGPVCGVIFPPNMGANGTATPSWDESFLMSVSNNDMSARTSDVSQCNEIHLNLFWLDDNLNPVEFAANEDITLEFEITTVKFNY